MCQKFAEGLGGVEKQRLNFVCFLRFDIGLGGGAGLGVVVCL